MTETAQRRAWAAFDSNEGAMVEIAFGPDRFRVARPTVDAWRALEAVLYAHGYDIRAGDTHGYFPRNIAGKNVRSLHAFGIAIDVNAETNPMRRTPDKRAVRFSPKPTQQERARDVAADDADTDMTPEMLDDVRKIKTLSGHQLFGWGGDWSSSKDPMHFHVDVAPARLSSGVDWATVLGAEGEPLGSESVEGAHEDDEVLTEEQDMISVRDVESFRPLLDFIAQHEGTANQPDKGYNTSLGYGIYTNGEQPLSRMTLAQIDALQTQMLARQKGKKSRSSALGRYQIIRTTLRDLRERLGLSLSEFYSPTLQDRLAFELIKRRGRNARGLQLEWESLQRVSAAVILAKFDEIPDGPIEHLPDPAFGGGAVRADDLLELFLRELRLRTGAIEPAATPQIVLKPGDSGPQVRALQEALSQRNYHVGKIDGIYGTLTKGAVASFQADYKVPTDLSGTVDGATWEMLGSAASRPLSPERMNITADELRRAGSMTIQNADRTRLIGWLSSALGALGIGNSAYNNLGATAPAVSAGAPVPAVSQGASGPLADLVKAVANSGIKDLKDLFPLTDAQITTAIGKAQLASRALGQTLNAATGAAPGGAASPLREAVESTLPIVINSILPGFGGSLAVLGLGLAANIFGSRIIARRVESQRTAANISPVGG